MKFGLFIFQHHVQVQLERLDSVNLGDSVSKKLKKLEYFWKGDIENRNKIKF